MSAAKLEVQTIFSQLTPLDETHPGVVELWAHLYETLAYEVHNNFFIKASSSNYFISDIWDGYNRLFNQKSGKFLTGLLPYVLEALKKFNVPYEMDDKRPIYTTNQSIPTTAIEPRHYQLDALNEILLNKRGIIFARPRSGKTIIEIMLVAKLNLFPVISICQSIDIARQTVEKFKQFLPQVEVGMVGDGECGIKPITVITIQSIMSAYNVKETIPKKELEKFLKQSDKGKVQTLAETAKIVWADECHHCVSNVWKYLLQNKIYSAEYIVGCSGTPYREDNTNLLLEGLLGPIIYEINYSTLIDEGFLVRPTIHLIKIPETMQFTTESYPTIYNKAIIENELRNKAIAKAIFSLTSTGRSCLVLVSKVTHGKELLKYMPYAKFSYSKSKDRESLWYQLKTKQILCLITTLGDEGVDIPNLDATIIAAGGESAIKVFQRMRCMTPYPGKTAAIMIDFLDPYKYLKIHSKKRAKLYKSEASFRITMKEAKA